MGQEPVPPCPDLGQDEHRLWQWMGEKAFGRPREHEWLLDQGARRVHLTRADIPYMLRTLVDNELIERMDLGATFGFQVLRICPGHEDFSKVSPSGGATGAGAETISRSDVVGATGEARRWGLRGEAEEAEPTSRDEPGVSNSWTLSQANDHVSLAQVVFPRLLADRGLPPAYFPKKDWRILARNLKGWHDRRLIDYSLIELMMQEFAVHPEWCRGSSTPAWKVFLANRAQLEYLVEERRRRDPGNRRYAPGGHDYWLRRHTPRATSPA